MLIFVLFAADRKGKFRECLSGGLERKYRSGEGSVGFAGQRTVSGGELKAGDCDKREISLNSFPGSIFKSRPPQKHRSAVRDDNERIKHLLSDGIR